MGRRRSYAAGLVAFSLAHALVGGSISAQGVSHERSKLTKAERDTTGWLIDEVDDVMSGAMPGGDAWLKLRPHFLREPDGNTYVPFTLLIDDAPTGFDSVAVYLRAMNHTGPPDEDATPGGPVLTDLSGTPPDQVPINMAETNHNFPDEPVASENSARAASIESELSRPRPLHPEFEDVHFMRAQRSGGAPAWIQSAMSLAPGDYDIYVAVGETTGEPSARSAVIVRRLLVPDLSGDELNASSIIVMDGIRSLSGPLSADEQVSRPYAFGSAELTPRIGVSFTPDDRLALLLFAYNLKAIGGMPEVSVEYRFFRVGIEETFFVATKPQRFGADTLPADFNLETAGNQLPINADVPLASFPPGSYRLEITITDEIAGAALRKNLLFSVSED